MSYILTCSVPHTVQGTEYICTGTVSVVAQTVNQEFTANDAVESLGAGLFVALPLLLIAWGGRIVLKTLAQS